MNTAHFCGGNIVFSIGVSLETGRVKTYIIYNPHESDRATRRFCFGNRCDRTAASRGSATACRRSDGWRAARQCAACPLRDRSDAWRAARPPPNARVGGPADQAVRTRRLSCLRAGWPSSRRGAPAPQPPRTGLLKFAPDGISSIQACAYFPKHGQPSDRCSDQERASNPCGSRPWSAGSASCSSRCARRRPWPTRAAAAQAHPTSHSAP